MCSNSFGHVPLDYYFRPDLPTHGVPDKPGPRTGNEEVGPPPPEPPYVAPSVVLPGAAPIHSFL